jgi:peroxiredoxin
MSQILSAGTVAPDFKLRVTPDQWLFLGDLKGRPVILAFYPADWSPVCGDQLESGLRRPDGALQRNPSRVPQTWR